MHIVNVVDIFYPDAGYENNVLSKYMVGLGHKYTVLTTEYLDFDSFFYSDNIKNRDEHFSQETGVEILRLNHKGLISGRVIWNYSLFKKTLALLDPDIVFLCGNDTLIAIQYLLDPFTNKENVIMDSHMLEMASKNRFAKIFRGFYKYIVAPIIINNNIKVIRVQDDDYVERCLGIPLNLSPFISFGTDTMLFSVSTEKRYRFRELHNIAMDDFVVIYAGKFDEAKGGLLLAETLKDRFDTDRKIVFLLIGNTYGEYGAEVEEILSKSENRIMRFATQKYVDLAEYYCAADLAIFAKQCSLSFYDVQACGLPVLSEDNIINIARCSHDNGWNFMAGSVEDFRNKLMEIFSMEDSLYSLYKENAVKFISNGYDYAVKAKEYEKIFIEDVLKLK